MFSFSRGKIPCKRLTAFQSKASVPSVLLGMCSQRSRPPLFAQCFPSFFSDEGNHERLIPITFDVYTSSVPFQRRGDHLQSPQFKLENVIMVGRAPKAPSEKRSLVLNLEDGPASHQEAMWTVVIEFKNVILKRF